MPTIFTHLKPKSPDEIRAELLKLSDAELYNLVRRGGQIKSTENVEAIEERWGKSCTIEEFYYDGISKEKKIIFSEIENVYIWRAEPSFTTVLFVTITSGDLRRSVTFAIAEVTLGFNVTVQNVAARTIFDQVGVAPMQKPSGRLMYLDYAYRNKQEQPIDFENLSAW